MFGPAQPPHTARLLGHPSRLRPSQNRLPSSSHGVDELAGHTGGKDPGSKTQTTIISEGAAQGRQEKNKKLPLFEAARHSCPGGYPPSERARQTDILFELQVHTRAVKLGRPMPRAERPPPEYPP